MSEGLAENSDQFQIPLRFWGKALWHGLSTWLCPSHCLICHEAVQEQPGLCMQCWPKMHFLEEPLCPVMGTGFSYAQGEGAISVAALAHPPVWNHARAAVLFDEHSSEIVHAFKYGDRAEAGIFMARMMARVGAKLVAEADMLVPVPLHWTRLWQRRFNQAGILAQAIARAAHKPYEPCLLKRLRATPQQVGLNAVARQKNLHGAFGLADGAASKIRGKSILLIDDVRTTGATFSTCVKVLKGAGARRVDVLSFALVDLPVRPHNKG